MTTSCISHYVELESDWIETEKDVHTIGQEANLDVIDSLKRLLYCCIFSCNVLTFSQTHTREDSG
jgi:hypothetical protein